MINYVIIHYFFRFVLRREYLSGVVRIRASSGDVEFAPPGGEGYEGTNSRQVSGSGKISTRRISQFSRGKIGRVVSIISGSFYSINPSEKNQ